MEKHPAKYKLGQMVWCVAYQGVFAGIMRKRVVCIAHNPKWFGNEEMNYQLEDGSVGRPYWGAESKISTSFEKLVPQVNEINNRRLNNLST